MFFLQHRGLRINQVTVRKNTHAGPQRMPSADVPTCGQKRHTRWPDRILRHAMNYGCGSAIVTWIQASKHKNITILNTWIYQHNITIPSVILKELVVCGGCNEWRLLIRHRAVRKDTHGGLQRMLRHAMNYWPATNSKSWCAIMRSEKTHTLACNECFGMQWITDAVLNPYLPVSFAR